MPTRNWRRGVAALVVGLTLACGATSARGQATDRRIEDALAEIAQLKRTITEQDRRITELEQLLRDLAPNPGSARPAQPGQPAPALRSVTPAPAPLPSHSTLAAWMLPENWDRIEIGMSRAKVVEILGTPSAEDETGPIRWLFYSGDFLGGGPLKGKLQVKDGEVRQIFRPVFK